MAYVPGVGIEFQPGLERVFFNVSNFRRGKSMVRIRSIARESRACGIATGKSSPWTWDVA
jgi:hypothetical protein